MAPKDMVSTLMDGVRVIRFNRPEKKNAINLDMYRTLARILNEDAVNDFVVVTIITGNGEFYSSGNDIKSALAENAPTDVTHVKDLVNAMIDYPKLLIAVVNGPAIGIAATTCALCDIVYASDRAYFDTPFVALGLCAEGGSSLAFPQILGRSKASEVLLLGQKMSAQEAYAFNFVSKVVPHDKVPELIRGLYKFGKLSPNSVKVNKALIMANYKGVLAACNERECEALIGCVQSEDFTKGVMQFLARKSKL